MRELKKCFFSILLLCMCVTFVGLFATGCDNGRAKLEEQIADLTLQNEQLTAEKGELEDRLEESTLQNSELQSKSNVVNNLVDYVNEKITNNFYNWYLSEKLISILKNTVLLIADSNNRDEIDNIYTEAIIQIDGIATYDYNGQFFTLKEAFDKGYITHEDLLDIARSAEDYDNRQQIKEEKVINAIKSDFYALQKNEYPDKTVEDVRIQFYFGNYNGFYVMQIPEFQSAYPDGHYYYVVDEVEIFLSGPEPLVWCLL